MVLSGSPGKIAMKKQVEYLQRLFYDIWNDYGAVYLLVKYSTKSPIGERGFTDEEKKRGLVLLFNNKTNTTLDWDVEGNLDCVLAFGAQKEDVFIHHDDLVGVFSQEAGVQYLRNDMSEEPSAPSEGSAEPGEDRHVVSLSTFKKRKNKQE